MAIWSPRQPNWFHTLTYILLSSHIYIFFYSFIFFDAGLKLSMNFLLFHL